MSDVYEKYHSDLNKKHIWGIVTDILNKEYGIVLKDIPKSEDDFQKSLIQTFSSQQSDDLVSLNKSLIDSYISHAKENYKKTDVDNKLTQLLQQRESIFQPKVVEEPIIKKDAIIEKDPIIKKDLIIEKKPIPENVSENIKQPTIITINSSKRSNVLSSRYCYSYDLEKHSIDSQQLHHLTKLVIPIEDVYIFSHPIIVIYLKELDTTIYLQKTDTIENNGRTFGVYESNDKNILPLKDIQKLTIDIRDVSETKYANYDIIKINKLTINGDNVIFTCSHFQKTDFQVGDTIKLININLRKYKRLFTYPLKIKEIQDNLITCDLEDEYKDITDETIDMKMLNISNQNIVYFN